MCLSIYAYVNLRRRRWQWRHKRKAQQPQFFRCCLAIAWTRWRGQVPFSTSRQSEKNEEERACNQTKTVNSALCRCSLKNTCNDVCFICCSNRGCCCCRVSLSNFLSQRSSCYCSFCFMTNRKGKEHNTLLIRCLSSIFVPASTQVPGWCRLLTDTGRPWTGLFN